ncbi:MAG: hypothetical protein J6A07_07945 [Firmicutes bacterium]|nr:hypothetical protein [Bacillota bacterium]
MHDKKLIRRYARIITGCAFSYFALDFSVRLTQFLRFGDSIGIKNSLAAIFGLIFGPYGVVGCCIGCIAAAFCMGQLSIYTFYECLASVIVGLGLWYLWYIKKESVEVFLKTPKEYLHYILSLFILSAAAGLFGMTILPDHRFMPNFAAYFVMGIVVGIPILILLTSIISVKPIRPHWVGESGYFRGSLSEDSSSLSIFNEELEDYAKMRGVKISELLGVQNCIEEVYLRLREGNPQLVASVNVNFHNSVSIDFEYPGIKVNPFKADKKSRGEELIGLKLILYRSLRCSHSYFDGINYVHIVM